MKAEDRQRVTLLAMIQESLIGWGEGPVPGQIAKVLRKQWPHWWKIAAMARRFWGRIPCDLDEAIAWANAWDRRRRKLEFAAIRASFIKQPKRHHPAWLLHHRLERRQNCLHRLKQAEHQFGAVIADLEEQLAYWTTPWDGHDGPRMDEKTPVCETASEPTGPDTGGVNSATP